MLRAELQIRVFEPSDVVQFRYVVYPPAGPEGISYKKMMEEKKRAQESEPKGVGLT
jgi:hypothetical protein